MKVLSLTVGVVQTNCYIVYDEASREGAVIDPGDNAESILKAVRDEGITVKYILLTHAHFDHVLAAAAVKEATGALLVLHGDDVPYLNRDAMRDFAPYVKHYVEPSVDLVAHEGTEVRFGGMTAVYLHTPGHTPGSCTIRIGDTLFTGDTMFRHECGRCDLPGGDFDKMLRSLARLAGMAGDYTVLPGHEGFSTLEEERRANPYVRQALSR